MSTEIRQPATASYDEAYFVGGSKSNYVDYGDVEPAIDLGFMPEVRRYAAYAGAGKTTKSYLDVGCAYGFYVQRLAALGWKAAGVDVSEYAIARGKERGVTNLYVAPAQTLPFPDESFDFITSIDVIEHIATDDAARAAAETHRVLRKGGVAFFATPNVLTNCYWNIYTPGFHDPDDTHINYHSVESLRTLFARFSRCDIYGHTPFIDQFRAFEQSDAFTSRLFVPRRLRTLTRHVAWKLLGRSVQYSSYLHAIVTK